MNFKEGVIIPIDKPYGITSFKALAHVRYLCSKMQGGRVKIGHAGTLDPLATGVLISHRTYHERIDRNSIAAIYWRYRTSATHL